MKEIKKAPDFTLRDQFGNRFNLYDSLKNNPVLLVFYPKDKSPVCSAQFRHYNKNENIFKENNIQLVGINSGSREEHLSFCKINAIKFPLLIDNELRVAGMYNALYFGKIVKRKIILINQSADIILERTVLPIFYQTAGSILKTGVSRKNYSEQ
ncbi:MAG: peroxiredoxin [Ignavibacteriaceae bacterium]